MSFASEMPPETMIFELNNPETFSTNLIFGPLKVPSFDMSVTIICFILPRTLFFRLSRLISEVSCHPDNATLSFFKSSPSITSFVKDSITSFRKVLSLKIFVPKIR